MAKLVLTAEFQHAVEVSRSLEFWFRSIQRAQNRAQLEVRQESVRGLRRAYDDLGGRIRALEKRVERENRAIGFVPPDAES